MIRYSCHSENFGIMSQENTFSTIHNLGFDCIDVASRSLIPQTQILAAPKASACKLHDLAIQYQLPLSELFLSSVELDGTPISPASPKANDSDFDQHFDLICQFAEQAGFLSIMGTAGTCVSPNDYPDAFSNTARTLQKQVEIAAFHGLEFHVEPYRLSLLHTVNACLEMADAVPGLRYTLDFLHFQIQGIPLQQSLSLLPLAGHLHARQAKRGIGKCDFFQGEIDYAAIVHEMKRLQWSGDIAMEFWTTPGLELQGLQAIEQNIVMRCCLKHLFASNSHANSLISSNPASPSTRSQSPNSCRPI